MKKFLKILCMFIIIFLLIPASGDTVSDDIYNIKHTAAVMGNAGHFYIPSVDIDVPLYKYTVDGHQKVVDAENSAVYCESFNGGCGYIADHAFQGFDKIKNAKIGCYAYIRTENEIKIYQCVEIAYGRNEIYDIATYGEQYLTKIYWADFCCYTCNDKNGVEITMLFFREKNS